MVITQPPNDRGVDRAVLAIGAEIRQSVDALQEAVSTLSQSLTKADDVLPLLHQHRRLYRVELIVYSACVMVMVAVAAAAVAFVIGVFR